MTENEKTLGDGFGDSHIPYGPENPAMGGVDIGKEFHPTREDFEKEKERMRRQETTDAIYVEKFKVRRFFTNMTDWNNAIHLPAWEWLAIFVIWWMAMMFFMFFLPSGLSAIYEMNHLTFNIGGVVFLLNVAGFMLVPGFPAYILFYLIMSLSQFGRRR